MRCLFTILFLGAVLSACCFHKSDDDADAQAPLATDDDAAMPGPHRHRRVKFPMRNRRPMADPDAGTPAMP